MQALSKPFVGQRIECRSARQTQRVRSTVVVRAAQEEQNLVRRTSIREENQLISAMCYLHFQDPPAIYFGVSLSWDWTVKMCSCIISASSVPMTSTNCRCRLVAACWVASSEQLPCCPPRRMLQLPLETPPG